MSEFAEAMKRRTKQFAVRVVRLVESLPGNRSSNHMGGQLLRCSTSVAANYRAACRARSKAEFRAKLGIVEEELDETLFWMELMVELTLVTAELLNALVQEADELMRIIVTSIRTSRRNS